MLRGDSLHLSDIHGAFKKCLEPFTSKELLTDLHICIESLRQSFASIAQGIRQFVLLYVRFIDTGIEDPLTFWIRIGVHDGMLDTMVDMDPYWDGSVLMVSRRVQVSEDPHVVSLQTRSFLGVSFFCFWGWY